ncbi:MAG: hypothetical protein ACKVPX_13860 [Myxococcaceae bacterium]
MTKPGGHGAAMQVVFDRGETALLLSCMDLRLLDEIVRELDKRGLTNRYDHVILAGASLGAVTPRFPHWGRMFYEHLALAKTLHGVTRVIILDHRDCGAYEQLLHLQLAKDKDREAQVHLAHQQKLRRKIHALDPTLQVDCWLMDLAGTIHDASAEPDLWLPGISERRRTTRKARQVRRSPLAARSKRRTGRARPRR